MPSEIVVEEKRSAALSTVPLPSTDPLLALMERLASNSALDAEKIDKLLNVFIEGQRKMRSMNDEAEFHHRMAEFKQNPPDVVKSRKAKLQGTAKGSGREYEFEYSYADLDAFAEAAMPGLAEKGITWDFPTEDTGKELVVSCILHYGLYSHKGATLRANLGVTGMSNGMWDKGAIQSYLMRYTFCASTGLTAGMPDNDGKLPPSLPEAERSKHLKAINESKTLAELKAAKLTGLKAADEAKDKTFYSVLQKAVNSKFPELKAKEPNGDH